MSLNGQSVRFKAGEEVEVPELLVDECIRKGLIPADDFKQAVREAAAEESLEIAAEDEEALADTADASRIRADAMARASEEADMEAAEEAAALKLKRSEAAKKAAATKAANKLNAA